jgi:hypothetical protein
MQACPLPSIVADSKHFVAEMYRESSRRNMMASSVMLARVLLTLSLLVCVTGLYATWLPSPQPAVMHELATLRHAQLLYPESRIYLQEKEDRLRFSAAYTIESARYHASESARYSERGNYLLFALLILVASALLQFGAQRLRQPAAA